MSYRINLAEVDADGAVREAHAAAIDGLDAGDTRLSFLKKMGLGTAGVVGGGAVLGALAPSALAAGRPPTKFGKGDIGIANFALTLEYLEREFYDLATAGGKITDPETAQFLAVTTRDERAHVAALIGLIKKFHGKPVKKPKFDFKGTTNDQGMFQQTAFTLENTGVKAYSGQALNIKSPAVVKAALSILTIEARHASVIGRIIEGANGISPGGAFDSSRTANQILAAVKATGFIVG